MKNVAMLWVIAMLCGVILPLHAELAPVLDESLDASQATSTVVSSDDAAMLPAKTRALVEMNLPEKLSQLQQQMTQLRGQLEMAQFRIKQLSRQQRALSLYMSHASGTATAVAKQPAPAATPETVAANDEEQRYHAAYEQLQKHHYDLAMAQFNDYLARFPKGKYRPNAYYWLGEMYLLRHQDAKAVAAFDQVITQYPLSHKVPDAMLKKGVALQNQGQTQAAQQLQRALIEKFPTSGAAKLAGRQLAQQSSAVV